MRSHSWLLSLRARDWFRHLAIVLVCMVAAQTVGFAQGVRGSIAGQVTDPTGAVVKGASIRLVNANTGTDVRTIQTSDGGDYRFIEIEPGAYDLIVSASGFGEARLTGIDIEPNRTVTLDVALTAAGVTDQVEITASDELVDKESAQLGTTVEHERVVGLPLNGRNALQLALLQPGVQPGGGGFGGGLGIRVNGNRAVENNLQLDGSNNNEVAVGGANTTTPRPDSIEEFRLLTSNFDAEFGRNTGAVINVVTRSGTNEYHGNVRIFYRPTFLSASRFFDNARFRDKPPTEGERDQIKRIFERKEFGGNFGGPVWIPKIYNGREKTFFFIDYEGRRQLVQDTAILSGIPTAAERMGDFSASPVIVRDPVTRQPFPDNRIPASRFSPIALWYLQYVPLGNEANQAFVSGHNRTRANQVTGRVDHRITDDQTINYTLNYSDSFNLSPFAFGGSNVPGFGSINTVTGQNHIVRHVYSLTPTFVNSFLASYSRNDFPAVEPQNRINPRDIGFTGNFIAREDLAGAPQIRLLDRGLVIGNSIQGPQSRVSENFQIQDSVSWAKGDHQIKFGFDGTLYRQDQAFLFINQGIFTYSGRFGGNTTRNDFADFLIGNSPIAFQTGSNGERDYRQKYVSWFVQDRWKVRDDLTLTLGLRYEYTSPLTDKFNRVAFYREGATSDLLTSGQLRDNFGNQILVRPGGRAPMGLVYVGDPDPVLGGTVPEGGVALDLNNFAPRVGIAYAPQFDGGVLRMLFGERDTSIRAGWGVYYGYIIGDTALQQLSAPGFSGTNAFFFPGSGTLADPFAPDPFPQYGGQQPDYESPFDQNQFFITAPLSIAAQPIDPNIRTPYNLNYNLTIERGFLENYVASASYVGQRGLKGYAQEQINPALGTFFPAPPGRTIPAPTPTNANQRRANPDFQTGLGMLVSASRSWYNALQLNLQRRYTDGLGFQVAYTFSKNINDVDTQRGGLDLLDRNFGKSLSSDDVPHRFVASWLWELPWGKETDGWVRRVAHGWQINGIYSAESGKPFTVGNLFDTTGTGGGVFSFADIGEPIVFFDPHSNDLRVFNADAFEAFQVNLAAGEHRRGTQGANQFRLPNGINNWDLALIKKTDLWSETSNLELRVELFNAFNHTQFTTVDLNLGNVVRRDDGTIDETRSTFGKFVDAREARIVQLAARISF